MALQRALLAGLAIIIILVPLPFGSVQAWARACLTASCFGLAILWGIWRSRCGLAPIPLKDPVLLVGALCGFIGVLQILPLPRPVIQVVSPGAVEIRDRYETPAQPRELVGDDSTTPFKGMRPLSLDPWATRRATLTFIGYLFVILMTIDLAGDVLARRTLMVAFIISGAFQAIYGLSEYVSARQHIFGYVKRYYTDVATGTFINRNHYAGYIAMTLPVVLALSSEFASRLRTNPTCRGQVTSVDVVGRNLYSACALLAVALTMAIALASSRSRMGILCALSSIIVIGAVIAWRSRQKIYAIAGSLLAVFTVVILYQGEVGSSIVNRFLALSSASHPELGRWQVWSQTLAMAKRFPVIGIGWGAYSNVFQMFRSSGQGTSIDHAENDYLQLLSEIGILGAASCLLAAICVLMPILKRRVARPDFGMLGYGATAGVMAIALHSIVDSNLTIPSNIFTFTILMGLIVAWWRIPPPTLARTPDSRRMPRNSLYLICTLLAMGGIASIAFGVPLPNNPRPQDGVVLRYENADTDVEASAQLGMIVDGTNPQRLLRVAGVLGREAHDDMRALLMAKPNGPFSEVTIDYVIQRIRRAQSILRLSICNRPTMSNGHIAMADLVLSECAALTLKGSLAIDCFKTAESELWAALEVNPMSARTHARVASVIMAAWAQFNPETRERFRDVIELALQLNPHDDALRAAVRARRN